MEAHEIETVAKAAYPELWPDDYNGLKPEIKATLAFNRQAVLERTVKTIEAFKALPVSENQLGETVEVGLPGDAAMISQILTTICYVDNDGRMAYTVHTEGEGLLTTWLGMTTLAQNYLLNQFGFGAKRDEGDG